MPIIEQEHANTIQMLLDHALQGHFQTCIRSFMQEYGITAQDINLADLELAEAAGSDPLFDLEELEELEADALEEVSSGGPTPATSIGSSHE